MNTYTVETSNHLIAELNKINVCDTLDPVVTLQPDGFFYAIDRNTYDCDCDQDGFFTTSPVGYGRTPLDAIIDLLDTMAGA